MPLKNCVSVCFRSCAKSKQALNQLAWLHVVPPAFVPPLDSTSRDLPQILSVKKVPSETDESEISGDSDGSGNNNDDEGSDDDEDENADGSDGGAGVQGNGIVMDSWLVRELTDVST